jgi:hypothetical protein
VAVQLGLPLLERRGCGLIAHRPQITSRRP